jgi:hypothetical protein
MKTVLLGMGHALAVVELAARERSRVGRVGQALVPFRQAEGRELAEELAPPLAHLFRQLGMMVGEVQERRRGCELLPLEKHRSTRAEEHDGGDRPVSPWRGELAAAQPGGRIGDLVVVLDEADEYVRGDPERRGAAPLLLPRVALPLVEIAVLERGHEFLGVPAVVAVVGVVARGEHHLCAVMEIVVPERVHSVPALGLRFHEPRLLRLVLGNDYRLPRPRRRAHLADDGREDVVGAGIEDALRRVEAQAVEVELLDPVAGVGEKERAHGPAVRAVEVERLAPLRLVAVGEVVVRVLGEVVAVRAEVVVHDVEDHGQAIGVRVIHEPPRVVGRSVEARGREEVDAVVAPAELPGEIADRHDLDDGDPDLGQVAQFAARGLPRPLGGEGAHVHLVDHLPADTPALPPRVGPPIRRRVDHHRGPVRPLGLEARSGIGEPRVPVEHVPVSRSRRGVGHDRAEVPGSLGGERDYAGIAAIA